MRSSILQFNLYVILTISIICVSIFGQVSQNKLKITIKDPLGNYINQANVTITSTTYKKLKINKTNDEGYTEFKEIIDGEYFILVSAVGFSEYKSDVILLKSNESKNIQITLEVLPIEENVSIDENEEEKRNSFGGIKILSTDEINRLPEDPDQFEKALQRMAGVSVTGGALPITVNGLEGSKIPNKEDIKSITIYREIFSAQFEGTSGERIEIQTKSSRSKFGKDFRLSFGDSALNARNPFLTEKNKTTLKDFSIYLYGPVSNKISWATYIEFSNRDNGSAINAITLNSILQPFSFKKFQKVPKNSKLGTLTLDASPTEKFKANLRYSFQTTTTKNLGVGGFSLPSRAFSTTDQTHGIRFNTVYVFNPNIFNSAKGAIVFSGNRTQSLGNEVGVNVLDAFFDRGLGTFRRNNSIRTEFYDDVSITRNKLRLGFGGIFRTRRTVEESELSSSFYTFNGRIAPTLDTNNNPVLDLNGNLVTEFISSLESYRRTLIFTQNGLSPTQIRTLGGGASQLSISSGSSNISATQIDYAAYLQLAFPITNSITSSFGMRYENQTNIKSNLNIAPRFGIIWSPKQSEKVAPIFTLPRISAGFGWFYSRFGIENLFNTLRTNRSTTNFYTITNSSLLDSFPSIPTLSVIKQSNIGRSTLNIDKDLNAPFQTIFNLSLDKKITKIIGATFRFSSIKSARQTYTRNINAPLPNTYSESNPNNAIYPNGNSQAVFEIFSQGISETKRFQASVSASGIPILKRKVNLGMDYSFNQGKSNIVSGNSNYQNAYDFTDEFAPTTFDGVHNFGGWFETNLTKSLNLTFYSTFRTGLRFNIITGKDSNGDGFFTERPAFAKNLNKEGVIFTKYGALDPNPDFTDLIIPRNFARGSNFMDFSLILSKTFNLFVDEKTKKPKYRIRLNVNVNNIFNTNNLGNPNGNISSPNFLKILSANSADSTGRLSEPRSITFNLAF